MDENAGVKMDGMEDRLTFRIDKLIVKQKHYR
jgi:hypothetical protein